MNIAIFPVVILVFVAFQSAFAAEYPKDVQGNYVSANDKTDVACKNPVESIQKNARYNVADAECKPQKITKKDSSYVISEKCAREGRTWTQTTTFTLGSELTMTEPGGDGRPSSIKLRNCLIPTAKTSSGVKTCKVNQGQAGVTTFFDQNLTKSAPNAIRDFDGYTFKSEKTIVVKTSSGSTKVLVGKLFTSDGKLSSGNYALAEEWSCN